MTTPLERAEKIIAYSLATSTQTNEQLVELIRVAIVEATNAEVEKRRAVETAVAELEDALMPFAWVGLNPFDDPLADDQYRALELLRKRGRL